MPGVRAAALDFRLFSWEVWSIALKKKKKLRLTANNGAGYYYPILRTDIMLDIIFENQSTNT